jgi:uncharacterized sulfatase
VRSPNIDRLAARGTRFADAHCQYPLCNPSRVSFLTGLRPETTGVYSLAIAPRTAAPDAVTLPRFFRERGYFSAGAGKVFHNPRNSDPDAWDSYEDGETQDPQEQAAIKSRYGGGDGRPAWAALDGDGLSTRDGLNTTRIAGFIEERSATGKPFFLAAGFHKPHLPWTAPRRFFDLYAKDQTPPPAEPAMQGIPPIALQTELSGFQGPDSRTDAIRAYHACVSFTDDQIGRLLDTLDRKGLWDNTLVVLLSDNGFHLGDHGGLWAKLTQFGASTRVPLIFAGAGVPKGRVVTGPVELLDLYPTLVDLAGFPVPATLQGKSLVRLMRGEADPAARRAFSLVYHYDTAAKRDVAGRSVIGAGFRYTEWGHGLGREYYVRTSDPSEYVNRSGSPEVAAAEREAAEQLGRQPAPKPGPANRPRALASGAERVNE